MCSKLSLTLLQFKSNFHSVISTISDESVDRHEIFEVSDGYSDSIERVLVVVWSLQLDKFQFKITISTKPLTWRGILSTIGLIFNSLGYIGPYVLEGKKILKQLWVMDVMSDDPIPNKLLNTIDGKMNLISNLH